MSKTTWKELPTWHGAGEYGGACRCPRCGGEVNEYDDGEGMDNILLGEATCPTCGLQFVAVLLRDDLVDEDDCEQCGNYDWSGGGRDITWVEGEPWTTYYSICNVCGNGFEQDIAAKFITNSVHSDGRGGYDYINVEDVFDLID